MFVVWLLLRVVVYVCCFVVVESSSVCLLYCAPVGSSSVAQLHSTADEKTPRLFGSPIPRPMQITVKTPKTCEPIRFIWLLLGLVSLGRQCKLDIRF